MAKSERYYLAFMQHRQVSRRGLLRGFLRGSQQHFVVEQRLAKVARPPGALQESLFVHLCNQCRQCIDNCPMGIIATDKEGYPLLSLQYASCDGCKKCQISCQSGALRPQQRFDTRLRPLFNEKCINQSHSCAICSQVCPAAAININADHSLALNDPHCNGCGECYIACQRQAIVLELKD